MLKRNQRILGVSRRPPTPVQPASARAAAPPAMRVQLRDTQGSVFAALMASVLVIYLTMPPQYLVGDFNFLSTDEVTANPFGRAIKLSLICFSMLIVFWRTGLAWLEVRAVNPFFWLFVALVPTSILWSIDPGVTAARFVSLVSIVMVSLAFTLVAWHRTRFQDVLRPVVTLLLIGSVIFGIVYPEHAIEVGDKELKNAWRGLTVQKNQFGMLASFGAVLWLHAWLSQERRWFLALPFLALSVMCVFLSRSSTSLLATTLCAAFMLLAMKGPSSLKRLMPYIVTSFAILVVVYALAVLNIVPGMSLLLEPIAALAGKDLTFSNRAEIWDIIKQHIQLAPLLGSGYAAYWAGPVPSSPSYTFMRQMYFYPAEAHNGYLEIVNDLGFVGLVCLLGYLVSWVSQALTLLKYDRGQGLLYLAIFFQQAITNLSESTWLAINSAFAIVVTTIATFSLSRSLLEARRHPVRGR